MQTSSKEYSNAVIDITVVREAIEAFEASGEAPVSYALDFAVHIVDNVGETTLNTVLIEVTEAYSVGAYGLEPSHYLIFLLARWRQIVGLNSC